MQDYKQIQMTVRDLGNIAVSAGMRPSELIQLCETRRAASKPAA